MQVQRDTDFSQTNWNHVAENLNQQRVVRLWNNLQAGIVRMKAHWLWKEIFTVIVAESQHLISVGKQIVRRLVIITRDWNYYFTKSLLVMHSWRFFFPSNFISTKFNSTNVLLKVWGYNQHENYSKNILWITICIWGFGRSVASSPIVNHFWEDWLQFSHSFPLGTCGQQ